MDVGSVWDESKYEKTKEKHGVTFAEVVYAILPITAWEWGDFVSLASITLWADFV